MDERKRLERRIRHTRWEIAWSVAAGVLCLVSWFLPVLPDEKVFHFFVGFLTPLVIMHFLYLLGVRKELPRTLEKINREMRQSDHSLGSPAA